MSSVMLEKIVGAAHNFLKQVHILIIGVPSLPEGREGTDWRRRSYLV
jgi:hypothetical protein